MGRVKVYPGAKNPTHEISLSDGVQTWGLRLDSGPEAIQEVPVTPSTVHFSGGESKFGDWEPGMSHIEQRTWEGGRGLADFVDDPTRYFDAKMAWTLTPGKIFPVPNWKYSEPNELFTEGYQNLPGDMAWRTLGGDYRSIAEPVTHSSNWATYDSVWLWLRRVGTPSADLGVELWVKTSGYPDPLQIQAQGSVTIAEIPENESVLVKVDLSGGSALVGTESFIVIYGQLNDNAANHWEIGIDADGGTAFYNDGTFWHSNAPFSIYHRMLSAGTDRKWHLFEYQGALYGVDVPTDGTASNLFINGDRGMVTGASSTSLIDSNKSWASSQWVGAFIKIVAGTGAGQQKQITFNNATQIGIGAHGDSWEITPDTTSEYVIYHTPYWQRITGAVAIGNCSDVAVANEIVYLGGFQKNAIRRMRWNPAASPPAHELAQDVGNLADHLYVISDAGNGLQIYRTNAAAATISRAAPVTAWGVNLSFDADIPVGNSNLPVTKLFSHNGRLYAFKPDGRYLIETKKTTLASGKATASAASTLTDADQFWTTNAYKAKFVRITAGTGKGQERKISSNTATVLTVAANWTTNPDTTSEYEIFHNDYEVSKTLGEIGFIQSENNGEAALSYGLYSYFSWGGYALQRLYDASGNYTLESIGPDREEGLPDNRRGRIADLLGTPQGIIAAVQGDGFSSVLLLPDSANGWHEIFRGWASGEKIDHIFFQNSYRPRLWIAIGGDLVYQDWPQHSFNSLKDSGLTYHHEAILISSTIDMGAARLPKLIKEINAVVENLDSGIEVALDTQVNADVGSDRWITAGSFQINPEDSLDIGQGEVYQIRFRLRLRTGNESVPPVVHATVLEGFARTPVKYQWNLNLQVSDTLLKKSGVGSEPPPDAFLNWLKQAAISSRRIYMRAIWAQMDNRYVIVEPPKLTRQFTNEVTGFWGGQVEVSLREI